MQKADKTNLETLEWLSKARWPKGPVCQSCKKMGTSRMIRTRGIYQCKSCRKQFSVFTGTRFEGTRLTPFKLASAIIHFWKESRENYVTFYANANDAKAKDNTKLKARWKGTIGVRALSPEIGTYSTAQRLHKKLIATPFHESISLEKYVSALLR